MKKLRRFSFVVGCLVVAHIFAPVASAHPLGNFTINHYAGLRVSRDAIAVDYVLDMAEIPTFQEIATFDANHNGRPDPDEAANYHPAQCEAIRSQLDLRLKGDALSLTLVSSQIEFPSGAGGLLTLRLTCAFTATIAPISGSGQVEFKDNSYAERLGWREIVGTGEGVSLQGDVASTSVSQRLTAYPKDLLTSPLDQRQVAFSFTASAPADSEPTQTTTQNAQANSFGVGRSDAFTQLITLKELSLPTFLLALVIAVVWGALHAMTPGHGKTIVGAYLVGSRGTARHAVYLGLATTITHTAGVFALGLVTLFASRYILPERLFPWLSFISGLLVVVIGLSLFVSRLRPVFAAPTGYNPAHDHDPHHHEYGADHDHDHDHPHDHDHHDHEHGSRDHSHLPPGAGDSPVTWRSLLALGISGGLLPCPSALVVLLSAIALGRIGFGLVLVIAFSLGLAGTLTGIGLALVYAGRLFERLPTENKLVRLLPAASALFITLAGVGITAQAVVQIGLVKL